jgi:hypothetical protein
MPPFLFTRPVTQLKVQHWSEDDDAPEDQYEGVFAKLGPDCISSIRKLASWMGEESE